MSTQATNAETPHESIDGFVNFVLKEIKADAQFSEELLTTGSKTSLAQTIESLIIDPFTFRINALKRDHNDLVEMVNNYVIGYLKSKDKFINKVYKFNTVTGINYFLILNEDNTETREMFFQLLDHYESLQINSILPLNLSFLPKEVISKMTLPEVTLS